MKRFAIACLLAMAAFRSYGGTFPVQAFASCGGASPCNLQLTANPLGGTGPYTYAWAPGGATTQTVSGICS
ncbi:MAG TPA: hypothetical protein VJ853_09125, partial [Thermoanaerobaculia bacterium]|nr:hypothetical protein [Thermoanaerobaculia bacterium]